MVKVEFGTKRTYLNCNSLIFILDLQCSYKINCKNISEGVLELGEWSCSCFFRLPFALDSGTNVIIKSKKPKPIIELVATWKDKQRKVTVNQSFALA